MNYSGKLYSLAKRSKLNRIKGISIKFLLMCIIGLFVVFAVAMLGCSKNTPYLSNLNASAVSPIYTTYAASVDRSEFALDEGYEFHYYTPEKGINFTTDNAGELGLIFKIDNQWIYKSGEMYKAPVITTSYPDLVKYTYYPAEGVEVNASFFTYSSYTAVWEINITNNSTDKEIEILPFVKHNKGTFSRVENFNNYVFASHSEYPDGWVLQHKLPYHNVVRDLFYITDKSFESKIFNAENSGDYVLFNDASFKKKKAMHQFYGRIMSGGGDRTFPLRENMRLQVKIKGNDDIIITQNSPVWGNAEVINTSGLYRIELANLANLKDGDTCEFQFADLHSLAFAGFSEKIDVKETGNKRVDFKLSPYQLPQVPEGVRIEEDMLKWDKVDDNDIVYNIYERNYPKPFYRLVAKQKNEQFELKDTDKHKGYVVVAEKNGKRSLHSNEITTVKVIAFDDYLKTGISEENKLTENNLIAFSKIKTFKAGENYSFRMIRSVGEEKEKNQQLLIKAIEAEKLDISDFVKENEKLFENVPDVSFLPENQQMLYWSSFNMMRQSFLPPEEHSSYNYYVFSREPQWGWGHGGQVFHESIAMISYAYGFPESAMNSQRVYSERQYDNGYINYRTGSFLNEIIEYEDQLTSSAPWYSWLNWEVYKITGDKVFLEELYQSSKKFYNFYISNRDQDNDGLCEWGGHAVLESVRDALVAVWDEVGWPSNFEGADLNALLINEAKSLEAMANELGLAEEAKAWKEDYETRSLLYNETFWDEKNGFYYNVDKADNDFSFKEKDDLKRDEIIGFLPLWAGIASEEQAARLVEKLTDSATFWRPYGIPSLSAADSFYNAKGYWNGPVWVQWNYLIVRGLMNYGYKEEAKELVRRVSENMIENLKKNHNLWEFYSPDDIWAGYHKTYIWAGIINRMILEVNEIDKCLLLINL